MNIEEVLVEEISRLKKEIEALRESTRHDDYKCVLARWEGGEPTSDGGYRSMPVDETPECTCGLDEIGEGLK
jgi:hypothetical protein